MVKNKDANNPVADEDFAPVVVGFAHAVGAVYAQLVPSPK